MTEASWAVYKSGLDNRWRGRTGNMPGCQIHLCLIQFRAVVFIPGYSLDNVTSPEAGNRWQGHAFILTKSSSLNYSLIKVWKISHLMITNLIDRQTEFKLRKLLQYISSCVLRERRVKLRHIRVEVYLIGLHAGFVSWSVWVPSVHLELLYSGLNCRSCCCLGIPHGLARGTRWGISISIWHNNISKKICD